MYEHLTVLYVATFLQAAYASYLTSPSGYGLLGPSAAAAAISSLTSPAPSPLQLPGSSSLAASSPPLISPRLTPKDGAASNSNGSDLSTDSGGGGLPNSTQPLNLPPLPPLSSVSGPVIASSDDEADTIKQREMSHAFSGNKSLFSSFLPIRHLRQLRPQEGSSSASAAASVSPQPPHLAPIPNPINKENGFDSSSLPVAPRTSTSSAAMDS